MMIPQPIRYVRSARVLRFGKLTPAVVGIDSSDVVVSIHAQDHPDSRTSGGITNLDSVLAPVPADIHFHGAGGVLAAPNGAPLDLHAALDTASVPGYRYLATLPLLDPMRRQVPSLRKLPQQRRQPERVAVSGPAAGGVLCKPRACRDLAARVILCTRR